MAIATTTLCLSSPSAAAQNPDFSAPLTPFQIADHLYYVGSRDLASYLVVTPAGDILINANLTSSPPQIRRSVEQLGFAFTDIKIVLISHAHADHAGGSAEITRMTGAKYEVMDADVPVVESGGALDFAYPAMKYPIAKVDRVLHDGDKVQLGNVSLVAHKTPGHTRGCTTWTMQTTLDGIVRNVVIVGGWSINPDYHLVDNGKFYASYPGIATDYEEGYKTLSTLPCDLFLGAHGRYFNMLQKIDRAATTGDNGIWIDPAGYRSALGAQRKALEAQLAQEKTAP